MPFILHSKRCPPRPRTWGADVRGTSRRSAGGGGGLCLQAGMCAPPPSPAGPPPICSSRSPNPGCGETGTGQGEGARGGRLQLRLPPSSSWLWSHLLLLSRRRLMSALIQPNSPHLAQRLLGRLLPAWNSRRRLWLPPAGTRLFRSTSPTASHPGFPRGGRSRGAGSPGDSCSRRGLRASVATPWRGDSPTISAPRRKANPSATQVSNSLNMSAGQPDERLPRFCGSRACLTLFAGFLRAQRKPNETRPVDCTSKCTPGVCSTTGPGSNSWLLRAQRAASFRRWSVLFRWAAGTFLSTHTTHMHASPRAHSHAHTETHRHTHAYKLMAHVLAHRDVHTHTCKLVGKCACTAETHMHTHACNPWAHSHIQAQGHMCMRTDTHAHRHTCAHTHRSPRAHVHAHTQTHTSTHVHAHMRIQVHAQVQTCTCVHAHVCI